MKHNMEAHDVPVVEPTSDCQVVLTLDRIRQHGHLLPELVLELHHTGILDMHREWRRMCVYGCIWTQRSRRIVVRLCDGVGLR